ncbi:hypothetical protein [Paenibacillus wenxiniae]|uniref:Uncharacterized protein n=1 Tax=Paenibacillus wenxiniae TaxID=1636843 RepID=A0ABW4RHZ4_9BACL
MNISSSSSYTFSSNQSMYTGNNGNDSDPSDRSKTEQDRDNPQLQAEKAKEQKLKDQKLKDQKQNDQFAEEQKLQKKQEYKKEDKDKEVRQKDLNTLFEKQKEQQQGSDKTTHDILLESVYNQIGESSQLVITKENSTEAIKNLINRGFQVSADEERMMISSKVHQLKLEIGKDSYMRYVQSQQDRWSKVDSNVNEFSSVLNGK